MQKYRSIDRQAEFAVADFTVLLGPNNQGKSNLLRAAVLAMEVIETWASLPRSAGDGRPLPSRLFSRTRFRPAGRQPRAGEPVGYEWDRDFPLFARDRKGSQKSTVVTLEFELDQSEQVEFKTATNISTNHRLPVRVTLNDEGASLTVPKQGKGQHSKHAREIAGFVSSRIALLHVPAVRTGSVALGIADEILQARRRALARTPEYREAIEQVQKLDTIAVDDVQQLLSRTFARFVPDVKEVSLQVRGLERSGGLDDISIDDGVSTSITMKGDGVQSLAALALTLEWTNSTSQPERQLIVAVEEPESHLHPGAIHELREVLRGIATSQQVIVTTHSQALVNRADLSQNVIVSDRSARPAKSLTELRSALGIRLSDALTAADVNVICEGPHDEAVLPALLAQRHPEVADWITSGQVIFESAGGGSKIYGRVLAARNTLMEPIVVLDSDPAGRRDVERLVRDGYIDQRQVVQIVRPRCKSSELEDLFSLDTYLEDLEREVGFVLSHRQRSQLDKGRDQAWSERLKQILESAGVPHADVLVRRCKSTVQAAVLKEIGAGTNVVRPGCEDLVDRLVQLIASSLRSR